MAYTIVGTTTFASQANRDAARTRLDSALAGLTYSNFTSTIGTGVVNSGTTVLIISINLDGVDDTVAAASLNAVMTALTSANRHTSGYVGVNKV